jgi:hypothetical protein
VSKTLKSTVGIATLIALSGCATNWMAPPGVPPDQFVSMMSVCQQQGAAAGGDLSVPTSHARKASTRFAEDLAAGVAVSIGSAVQSAAAYNNCMEANGAVDASKLSKMQLAAVYSSAQPVAPAQLPQPGPGYLPTMYSVPDDSAARAQLAASNWITAQRILNSPDEQPRKHDLFLVLCGAGDETACIRAAALDRDPHHL